jgi:transposase
VSSDGGGDARAVFGSGSDVFVFVAGGARAEEASASGGPGDGRPSIPPEQLLSALLLQVFYGIRTERQLMEQLDYNLLYRWFVGLDADDAVWVPTTFTKNRERLQQGDIFQRFMRVLLNHPKVKPLLSDEHFSVDGTLNESPERSRRGPRIAASSQRTARAVMALTSTSRSARTIPMPASQIQQAAFTKGDFIVCKHT